MPVYEYVCSACAHRTDILHGVDESGPHFCPECGTEGSMRKAFAPPTIVFKGSGWAKKDRRGSSRSDSTAGSSTGGDGGKDGGSSSTTGSTSEKKPAKAAESTSGAAESRSGAAESTSGASGGTD